MVLTLAGHLEQLAENRCVNKGHPHVSGRLKTSSSRAVADIPATSSERIRSSTAALPSPPEATNDRYTIRSVRGCSVLIPSERRWQTITPLCSGPVSASSSAAL